MAGPPTPRSKPNTLAKKGKYRLAAALADRWSDEEIARWLSEVAAGRDPDAPRASDGKPAEAFRPLPEWKDRRWAMQMILAYRNGRPAQQVTIEDAQATSTTGRGVITPAQRAALDTAKRNQLRELLREVTGGAPRALPAEVAAARDANPTSGD